LKPDPIRIRNTGKNFYFYFSLSGNYIQLAELPLVHYLDEGNKAARETLLLLHG
jgi:hypothetical protein